MVPMLGGYRVAQRPMRVLLLRGREQNLICVEAIGQRLCKEDQIVLGRLCTVSDLMGVAESREHGWIAFLDRDLLYNV